MSFQYDQYLARHRANVKKGFDWLSENLPGLMTNTLTAGWNTEFAHDQSKNEPDGGTFEIPILKVNNKLAEGKSVLGNTPADAIGINKKNADRLSGADFDGDTVMVIPCNSTKSKVKITSTSPLKGLEGFDTKDAYGGTVKKLMV